VTLQLKRGPARLTPLVKAEDTVKPLQIVAAVVPVSSAYPCAGGVGISDYVALSRSTSLSDRYAAVKALGRFPEPKATAALLARVEDSKEHVYVRVDAAAGLLRRAHPAGVGFLRESLVGPYLENRLEAVIVLGEVGGAEATRLLLETLSSTDQHPEIRAGAAWSLGEVGAREALPALVRSFSGLETVVKIEAARALAKLTRAHMADVLAALPLGTTDERPGIAWALGKAGGFKVEQLFPALTDDDARHWVAYVIGTQGRDRVLGEIEALAKRDPEVYFAVTVLWKILASWVYELEEN
jgi:HEAT repeat protein